MGKSILCPYCFETFDNTDAMAQCENHSTRTMDGIPTEICEREENTRFNNHWDERVMSKHVFSPKIGMFKKLFGGYKPKAVKCDRCGADSTRYVCPHCNNWLPTEMIEKGSEIISVIGGPASGKSNYIVTLIQQLQKYGYKLELSILPQLVGRNKSEYTRALYEKARTTVFTDHEPVPKTPPTPHPIPWIFRLESHATQKAVYLVFYDTAGESFKDPEEMKRNAKYLAKSKAVIVILDTLSIPYVQRILESKKIVNQDIATPFLETMDALNNFATDNPHLYETPFAFVMSKFDSIISNKEDLDFDIEPFKANSSFIQTGEFSLRQVDEASDMIKSYMENQWDTGQLGYNVVKKWGDNARFFGMSALGAMTNPNTLKIDIPEKEDVKPFRVMDPLIWLLHKIGGFGIPVKKD